jgi:hypothetical protein
MTQVHDTATLPAIHEGDFETAVRKLHSSLVVDLWPDAGLLLGGRSRGATYKAAKDGSIPVIRIGRSLMVPTAKLRHMLGIEPEAA